jgi:hypothetical protein
MSSVYTVIPTAPWTGDMLVALCVWREARGEPYEAKLGVVWVLRNRSKMSPAQGWPDTPDANVLKPFQFSSFNSNDPNANLYPVGTQDPAFADCLKAAMTPWDDVPPPAFYRAVFYWSPPLTAAPHGWGPTVECSHIGNLHFCCFDTPLAAGTGTPVTV